MYVLIYKSDSVIVVFSCIFGLEARERLLEPGMVDLVRCTFEPTWRR